MGKLTPMYLERIDAAIRTPYNGDEMPSTQIDPYTVAFDFTRSDRSVVRITQDRTDGCVVSTPAWSVAAEHVLSTYETRRVHTIVQRLIREAQTQKQAAIIREDHEFHQPMAAGDRW